MYEVWTDEVTLDEFAGQTVGHYTDNKAVCYIMVMVMVMVEGGAVLRFFPCAPYETKTVSSPLLAKN